MNTTVNNNNIESKNGVNNSREEIKVGTEVWTTIELNEEYGKRGYVVRKYFADHGVWCLDIEFEDGTKATYAEEYVTTEKPWAVVGAKCRHKYLNRDVVLTITAVGQYYGIKAESEDGKVKRCDLVSYFEPVEEITEAEGVKVGDKVRHNKHEEVATVTAIREAFVNGCDGYRYLYTLDFGQSVKGPFDVELNGGEFLREALTLAPDYYSEYQKLGHQDQRPQEWLKKADSEERATYYKACVELERLAGDGLPLVIRADSADLSVNPWNALDKRVKTARVFHLGDRVKMRYPYQCNEVTGIINRVRFNEGSISLGGWCTHYDVLFDEAYQRPNNFGGKDVGVGVISPERIELIERAEFCPEPTSEWLQPGEKVAHYLDYGDGTGEWLIGNVTGYELCDDGTVMVIYGKYRTALKGMVKYQPEMDEKAA